MMSALVVLAVVAYEMNLELRSQALNVCWLNLSGEFSNTSLSRI